MFFREILIKLYKIISFFYTFVFGRKNMQFLNDILFSLTLNAKGYKNFGSFKKTGEKKFINRINKELLFCLDIGANVGEYTNLILSETKAKIISFEPLPKAFEDLKKLEKSNAERLKVFNIALGDKNEILDLNYSSEKSQTASFSKDLNKLSFYNFKDNKKIKTKISTLDDFFFENQDLFEENIDLIKIDAEGFEFEIINGAKEIIKKRPPKYIQLEFNWHQLFKRQTMCNFSKLLSDYDLYQILPHGNDLIKVDANRPEANIFHLANFVFIRKDISGFQQWKKIW